MSTIPQAVAIVRALRGAVRGPRLRRGQGVEGRGAGPQGDRLHAGLRAARARPRRGHAAGRHPRRRRRARGDPGRRLLPELHLPHPALDDRAGPDRPARLPRRHAVPVDLRRDPQPVGHVADPVQGQVRPLLRRAAELRGRDRRARSTCRSSSVLRDDLGRLRGAPITDAELNASIAVYNDNRARGPRPLRVPRAEALAGADLRGLPAAARRHGAAARGAHAARARLPRLQSTSCRARSATTRASCSTARSASSRRSG